MGKLSGQLSADESLSSDQLIQVKDLAPLLETASLLVDALAGDQDD